MYQQLLVPLDGSDTAECGFQEALRLAEQLKAKLCLLNVIDEFPLELEWAPATAYLEALKNMRLSGAAMLGKAKLVASNRGVACQSLVREAGQKRVADVILVVANQTGCDMIVMGTHGRRGLSHLTMGSDAELVVRSSSVPVVLVRQRQAA